MKLVLLMAYSDKIETSYSAAHRTTTQRLYNVYPNMVFSSNPSAL